MIRTPAPARIVRGAGALAVAGAELTQFGPRPVLVHGAVGEARVRDRLASAFAEVGLAPTRVRHEGLVTEASVARIAAAVRRAGSSAVVAVGGGRVLDAGKAAASACGVPCATIPTSPATCAAVTAIAVAYREDGSWAGPIPAHTCPALCVLDPHVLTGAPDRLLAAGVVDALVKVREVRLATRHSGGDDTWTVSTLALSSALSSALEDVVGTSAGSAVPSWPPPADSRARLAEAVVWLPGLIAGLAGEANKLAAAHAVHNALTRLPGHERALHGELVAFGLLVQEALDGAGDRDLARTVSWLRTLEIDPSLAGLGCEAYWRDPSLVVDRILEHPAMPRAFPTVDSDRLESVVRRVDRLARPSARSLGHGHAPRP